MCELDRRIVAAATGFVMRGGDVRGRRIHMNGPSHPTSWWIARVQSHRPDLVDALRDRVTIKNGPPMSGGPFLQL